MMVLVDDDDDDGGGGDDDFGDYEDIEDPSLKLYSLKVPIFFHFSLGTFPFVQQ